MNRVLVCPWQHLDVLYSALYIRIFSSPPREMGTRLYLDGRASFTTCGIDFYYRLTKIISHSATLSGGYKEVSGISVLVWLDEFHFLH